MGLFDGFRKKRNNIEPNSVNPIGGLPKFKYHPDPIKTGSVQKSNNRCESCGKKPGYIYVGPVFSEEELDECICPWCIANGQAHGKFDAEFTDVESIGDHGNWEEIPDNIKEEVAFRTPGFNGWQQEKWWTHCGDAAQYLGRVGHKELKALGSEALEAIRNSTGFNEGPEWETLLSSLDKDGSPTAYIFMCCKCEKLGGYQDCD